MKVFLTRAIAIASNPVLALGEYSVDLDSGRMKIGDGVKTYNQIGTINQDKNLLRFYNRFLRFFTAGTEPIDYYSANNVFDAVTKGGGVPVYRATLQQNGTNAPVELNVFENTTGLTFTPAYNAVGQFQLNVSGGSFIEAKVFISATSRNSLPRMHSIAYSGGNVYWAAFNDAGVATNDSEISIEIIVYP